MAVCSECGKSFSRMDNMLRHKLTVHKIRDEDDEEEENEETESSENSDTEDSEGNDGDEENENEDGDENEENDGDGDNGDAENESESGDEDEERNTYDLWDYLSTKAVNDETIKAQFEELMEKLADGELTEEEVAKQAGRVVKPDIRKHIYEHTINFLTLWHYAKEDETYKQIRRTKRKLIEEEDFGPREAITQAVKKRKFLIQRETGTLDDDPLVETLPLPTLRDKDDADEEEEEEEEEEE